jgi:endoribonuclease LACTB2
MNIVNVGYKSTNYYLIGPDQARLMVDIGWPGTLPQMLNQLKRQGVALSEVKYLLATHYHMDHAGLAQDLKDQGAQLIVIETQLAAIPLMARHMKPVDHYHEIDLRGNLDLAVDKTRAFLERIGIAGEILSTPGHSDDSVTLVLDEGQAFTGDLPTPMFATEETQVKVKRSWDLLRAHHVKTIYPAHGPVRKFDW